MGSKKNLSRRKFISSTGTLVAGSFLSVPFLSMNTSYSLASGGVSIDHVVAAHKRGRFRGWPANNGLWSWDNGRELLVGFKEGEYKLQAGLHNLIRLSPELRKLSRSTDGGRTWEVEYPQRDNYVDNEKGPFPSPGNINFGHPGFAMRVNYDRFFISYDRGKTWEGSYSWNGLSDAKELRGMTNASRTDYLVTGPDSALIIMAARNPELEHPMLEKPFVVETTDGGRTFNFVSWVVPWTNRYRAVMPSTVRTPDGKLICAVRCRDPRDEWRPNWIDSYISEDNGRSWSFLSWVGDTGVNNGNPPGLAVLSDGLLACTYANRTLQQMLIRFSSDNGASWGEPIVLRDADDRDLGYPQMVENHEGKLVALYYIQREEMPDSAYIEAAIITPPG